MTQTIEIEDRAAPESEPDLLSFDRISIDGEWMVISILATSPERLYPPRARTLIYRLNQSTWVLNQTIVDPPSQRPLLRGSLLVFSGTFGSAQLQVYEKDTGAHGQWAPVALLDMPSGLGGFFSVNRLRFHHRNR